MKVLWCWRCRMDLPMLDEEEFARIHLLLQRKQLRNEAGISSLKHAFAPALREYERLTGFRETNINAVLHHRLILFGPPCTACGKPLRTPQARYCAACGASRQPVPS
ncbi:hypothetical protein ACN6A1_35195 [Myxococcus virescens]|uniref:hypothetical protein n=1 Tax=Myxococcus virescens TaxID=83456 RepID=UPI003DA50742